MPEIEIFRKGFREGWTLAMHLAAQEVDALLPSDARVEGVVEMLRRLELLWETRQ